LKIRRDAVAVSSLLFTVALLMPTPAMWRVAVTGCESNPWDSGELYRAADCFAPAGFASLAVIAIGLIVAWTGYIKGVRWTWFVMFVIVWGWEFPVLILPYLHPWTGVADIAQSLASAVRESLVARPWSGLARDFLEVSLAFMLMVLALVLPLKTFIVGRGEWPRVSPGRKLGCP